MRDILYFCAVRLFKTTPNQPPQRVKKHTWSRNFHAWELRNNRREQDRHLSLVDDSTMRTCPNCHRRFVGSFCPRCGQSGTWSRYTFRRAILNFLDIWGLGNRPMFQTMRELFVRPGYMVRDYLNGQRQRYFPPFKMLAVMALLLVFVTWLTNQKHYSFLGEIVRIYNDSVADQLSAKSLSSGVSGIIDSLIQLLKFLSSSPLYEYLCLGVLYVLCVWGAFKRVSRFNVVETYIFLVFILVQFLLCIIPLRFCTGMYALLNEVVSSQSITPIKLIESQFLQILHEVFLSIFSKSWIFLLLLWVYDFHQFYQLGFRKTIWHMFMASLIGFVLVFLSIFFIYSLVLEGIVSALTFAISIVIAAITAYFALKYLHSIKADTNPVLYIVSKVALGVSLFLYIFIFEDLLLSTLWFLICASCSLLPIVIYHKLKRK